MQCIKENNELEEALNTMDIKIGLLVKNRITLQVCFSFVEFLLIFYRVALVNNLILLVIVVSIELHFSYYQVIAAQLPYC